MIDLDAAHAHAPRPPARAITATSWRDTPSSGAVPSTRITATTSRPERARASTSTAMSTGTRWVPERSRASTRSVPSSRGASVSAWLNAGLQSRCQT
ncbi:hypothetical protein ACN28S_26830 [Cystobacter fuscus]